MKAVHDCKMVEAVRSVKVPPPCLSPERHARLKIAAGLWKRCGRTGGGVARVRQIMRLPGRNSLAGARQLTRP
jgi:hypothetical protein